MQNLFCGKKGISQGRNGSEIEKLGVGCFFFLPDLHNLVWLMSIYMFKSEGDKTSAVKEWQSCTSQENDSLTRWWQGWNWESHQLEEKVSWHFCVTYWRQLETAVSAAINACIMCFIDQRCWKEKPFTHLKWMILKTLLMEHVMNVIGPSSVIEGWCELLT